jgi:hypothetical protein
MHSKLWQRCWIMQAVSTRAVRIATVTYRESGTR